jgi:hypothetical protein
MDHWLSRDYLPSIVFVVIIVVMDHHLKLEVGLGKKIRDGFGTGTRPESVIRPGNLFWAGTGTDIYVRRIVCTWLTHY